MPHSPAIEKLIRLFAKLPTVGPRTAARFVFDLIENDAKAALELAEAIKLLKEKIKLCPSCYQAFEPDDSHEKCSICSDLKRNQKIICLVEKEVDLETIEKTNSFRGLYFVLGKNISPIKDENPLLRERLQLLIKRLKQTPAEEIIIALNPTPEGQHTAGWLKRQLAPLSVKITQLAVGLPLGGELEYADEETLASSIDNRK